MPSGLAGGGAVTSEGGRTSPLGDGTALVLVLVLVLVLLEWPAAADDDDDLPALVIPLSQSS